MEGKPLSRLLPKVEVTFIEEEIGTYLAWFDDVHKMRSIPVSEADRFIERIKVDNKGKTVEVCIISHAEYLRYNEELEAEY